MEQVNPKRKVNLKVALILAGGSLLMLIAFQTFAIKKLMKTTDCIQTQQAIDIYGPKSVPQGDDENSRAIRDSLERCNITLPSETS